MEVSGSAFEHTSASFQIFSRVARGALHSREVACFAWAAAITANRTIFELSFGARGDTSVRIQEASLLARGAVAETSFTFLTVCGALIA
jgi:hypothetical protein